MLFPFFHSLSAPKPYWALSLSAVAHVEQISGGADRTAAKKAVEKLLNGLAGDGVSVKVTVVDFP